MTVLMPGFDWSDGLGGGPPPPLRGGRSGRLSLVELMDGERLESPNCLGSRNGILRGIWLCSGSDCTLSETCLCGAFDGNPPSRVVGRVETVFARTGIVVSVLLSCRGSTVEKPRVLGSRLSTTVFG